MSPERRRRSSRPPSGNIDVSPRLARQRRGGRRPGPARGAPRARRSPLRAAGLSLAATLRLLVLLGLLAGLGLVLVAPAFAARDIKVTGTSHLSAAEVLREAGLRAGQSVFLIDPAAAQRRLDADPWVEAASVQTSLPRGVTVQVTERQPYAVLRLGGEAVLLDEFGYVLGPAGTTTPDVVIAAGGKLPSSPGARALSGRLLQNLARVEQAAPTGFGLKITQWELAADFQLTADTAQGLRILFGQMATPEELDTLGAKLDALTSRVNLAQDCYGYVNVENPHVVACGVKPSPPPAAGPSPSPSPHH